MKWELAGLRNLTADWSDVVQPFWESPDGLTIARVPGARAAALADLSAGRPGVSRLATHAPPSDSRCDRGPRPLPWLRPGGWVGVFGACGCADPALAPEYFKGIGRGSGASPTAPFDLGHWASQGVLLLNTTLTVRPDAAGSHRGLGWETLTDQLIASANQVTRPLVFVLWGKDAQAKAGGINTTRHHLICSPHPSPLSAHRGFFGSRPFSRANAFLRQSAQPEVAWLPS